jgi:FKBP-type peptidyl-prolyl cis-trans isomerase
MKKQLSIALLGFSLSVLSSSILAADAADKTELSQEDKLNSSILAVDKPELSQKDKLSYSFGYSIGRSAKVQELTVNEKVFLQGFQDAQAGEAKLMEEPEIVETLTAHQKARLAKKMAEKSAKAGEAKAAGEDFLAENAKKECVTVLDSCLQYKFLISCKCKSPIPTYKVIRVSEGRLL